MATATTTLELEFEEEKETKGTWKFAEVLPGALDEAKIGALYVRKGALGSLGWEPGKRLKVTVEVA
jgi:hypothetical protein